MTAGGAGLALVWRLGAATTLIVMAFAMSAPVLAVLLQRAGHGTALVGAFSMLPFLVVAMLIPLAPRIIARLGPVPTYRAGAALQLLGVLCYALGDHLLVWSIGSIVSGVGATLLWNATETVLTQQAPPQTRGRVMGLYQTALGGALALGPFVPGLFGLTARAVLWGAAALVAACLASVAVLHGPPMRAPGHGRAGIRHGLSALPWLAAIALAGGVFEAGVSAVGSAYAASLGLGLGAAASVAGFIGVGSFLLQYPAGWAADHLPMRRVFGSAAGLLGASSIAVVFAADAPWLLWACGFVWGGLGGALYTLSIIQVAHAFHGQGTAGGTAAMITGYTWGGWLGPLASGTALQVAGPPGLALLLSLVALGAWVAGRNATA